MTDSISTTDGFSYTYDCASNTAFEINIDKEFSNKVDFALFKDDLCHINNLKI